MRDWIERRITRSVNVGGVRIGGGAPVVVQSMTNTPTADVEATLAQVRELAAAGCELVRLAVPDREASAAFAKIAALSPVPLIADIHFDYRLAMAALQNGAAKIRINPGNIGGREKLERLAGLAARMGIPIRVGVNAGSLERRVLKEHGEAGAEALVQSALDQVAVLESLGFRDIVVSLKASHVYTTIKAYRLFAEVSDLPLHLGVTEAGPLEPGLIKGAIGIGSLLADGLGDTIRLSLTAPPQEEVRLARRILQALQIRRFTPDLISCPTCGRCETDLLDLVKKVESLLQNCSLPLTIAVMGCAVNGPGEAREADLGICAGKKQGLIFRHGEVINTVPLDKLLPTFQRELAALVKEEGGE